MPSKLGHSTATALEPLLHGVIVGAPDIEALLPEVDLSNDPLQVPLGMNTLSCSIDRSLLGHQLLHRLYRQEVELRLCMEIQTRFLFMFLKL